MKQRLMPEDQWPSALSSHPSDDLAVDLLKQVLSDHPNASDIRLRFEEEGLPHFYIDGDDVTPEQAEDDG